MCGVMEALAVVLQLEGNALAPIVQALLVFRMMTSPRRLQGHLTIVHKAHCHDPRAVGYRKCCYGVPMNLYKEVVISILTVESSHPICFPSHGRITLPESQCTPHLFIYPMARPANAETLLSCH
ncbi:hypothetical protein BDN72DRAFT_839442 [Pluteus cervinus]|uniref:Uncharacterized protein n=1 Tax=Pluteus cervinus TaxID=181527 RepID=A0ACD3AWQ1_9AGAR|nr:hypothetical protein BDN72DRAFT_839442 [Pluteus cervinus]